MKTIVFCLVSVAVAFALSSCAQMQPTSSKSKTSADSGAGPYGYGSAQTQSNSSYQGANPYGTNNPSYGQYQQSADSYAPEGDHVSVTPTTPQYQGQYQAPTVPNPQMGSYQAAAQPYPQPSYQPLPQQAPSNQGAVAQSHVVQQGETLYRISKIYGSTVDGIKGVNGLSTDIIHPGDVLSIP